MFKGNIQSPVFKQIEHRGTRRGQPPAVKLPPWSVPRRRSPRTPNGDPIMGPTAYAEALNAAFTGGFSLGVACGAGGLYVVAVAVRWYRERSA